MQNTLLVTIQGSQRSVDVALPGDARVGELLRLLHEMCGSPGLGAEGAWKISACSLYLPRLSRLLEDDRTFFEHGVRTGDVLAIQEKYRPPDAGGNLQIDVPQNIEFLRVGLFRG